MARVYKPKDKRGGLWWIDFVDANGRRRRVNTRTRQKRIAMEILDSTVGKVARHEHLGVIEDSKISFAEFAEIWWQRVSPSLKARTQERWRGILDLHLKPAFAGSLRGVTAAAVEEYRRGRRESCSPS